MSGQAGGVGEPLGARDDEGDTLGEVLNFLTNLPRGARGGINLSRAKKKHHFRKKFETGKKCMLKRDGYTEMHSLFTSYRSATT